MYGKSKAHLFEIDALRTSAHPIHFVDFRARSSEDMRKIHNHLLNGMRQDHTNWLIHFVRDRLPEQDFPGETEEEYLHHVGAELEPDADAFCVLKTIIRLGGLYPGYSLRSGRTTIYGGEPVVCATEMPLYSFAKYVNDTANQGRVSAYGIAFLKSEFFEAGGRPVIYGLSNSNVTYKKNTATCRIMADSVLPLPEQFRYVSYNPSGEKWIDWSHEREWRWKVQDSETDFIWGLDGYGYYDGIPGLPLFTGKENDGHFSKLAIIVWKKKELKEVQELMTGLYLAESNNYGTPFSRSLIENSSVIVLEDVVRAVEEGHSDSQTIEGLHADRLSSPVIVTTAPENAEEIINSAFAKAVSVGESAAVEYEKTHDIHVGSCGFVNLVTYDVTEPIVQYMLQSGKAAGPFDGTVHIRIRGNWAVTQCMDYEEHIYEAMKPVLSEELQIPLYVQSRLD